MTRAVVIGWVTLVPMLLGAGQPVVKSAAAAPNLERSSTEPMAGSGPTAAYSVVLSPKRTVWLFSDTWVGKIRDGRRTDATIVNNTVGVQEGAGGHGRGAREGPSEPTDGGRKGACGIAQRRRGVAVLPRRVVG